MFVIVFHRATIKPDSEAERLLKIKMEDQMKLKKQGKDVKTFDIGKDLKEVKMKIKKYINIPETTVGIVIPHDAKWQGIKKNFPDCDIIVARYGEIIAHH